VQLKRGQGKGKVKPSKVNKKMRNQLRHGPPTGLKREDDRRDVICTSKTNLETKNKKIGRGGGGGGTIADRPDVATIDGVRKFGVKGFSEHVGVKSLSGLKHTRPVKGHEM